MIGKNPNKKPIRKESPDKKPQRDGQAKRDEIWKEHKGMAICRYCENVRIKKQWHHGVEDVGGQVNKETMDNIKKEVCPACSTIRQNMFAGEVLIENFPERFRDELLNLISNFGRDATKRDPQARIITVGTTEKGYRVTTTENQMASRLAKKIKKVFNAVKIDFSHSSEPYEVNRVRVEYKKEE